MLFSDFTSLARTKTSRWDPRTKITVLLCFSVLAVTLDRPVSLLVLFLFVVGGYFFAKPPGRLYRYLVPIMVIGTWGIMIGQAIFYAQFPRTVLVTLIPRETPVLGELTGGVYLYREGFYYGAVQSLRFIATVSLGLLIGFTTDPRHLLSGLMSLRVPYPLAFMVTMALRYVPTVLEEGLVVLRSQRLRGMRIWHGNPTATLITLLNLLKPILIRNARRAGTIADSIQSRGFSPQVNVQDWKRSALHPIRLKIHDYLVISSVLILTFGCLTAKLAYLVYAKGIYYQPWLRPVYDIVRRWI